MVWGGSHPLALSLDSWGKLLSILRLLSLPLATRTADLISTVFSQIQNVLTVYYYGICVRPPPTMSSAHRFSHFYTGGHHLFPGISQVLQSAAPPSAFSQSAFQSVLSLGHQREERGRDFDLPLGHYQYSQLCWNEHGINHLIHFILVLG